MKLQGQPGVEITLEVDGTALQEYDIDDVAVADPKQGVKYVEAVEGAQFTIKIQMQRNQLRRLESNDEVRAKVYLDGFCAEGCIMPVLSTPRYSLTLQGASRNQDGQGVLQPFGFSQIHTIDKSTQGPLMKDFKNLGEIKVRCYFCQTADEIQNPRSQWRSPIGKDGLPEKCLKGRAISNQATLGKSKPLGYKMRTFNVNYPYGKKPFATYVFRYRSRRDLQIEGIIPRSPTPVPLEDRDPSDLTPDEMREVISRLRAKNTHNVKQENSEKIKKEKRSCEGYAEDNGDDEDEPIITAEFNKRARLAPDTGVEVIDLID